MQGFATALVPNWSGSLKLPAAIHIYARCPRNCIPSGSGLVSGVVAGYPLAKTWPPPPPGRQKCWPNWHKLARRRTPTCFRTLRLNATRAEATQKCIVLFFYTEWGFLIWYTALSVLWFIVRTRWLKKKSIVLLSLSPSSQWHCIFNTTLTYVFF